ncbi:polyprotein [Elysia marginata]|uniref:Polyprotein n=1 Tax=Elysia marginata TaxID=1093978 RepID=A0AAV4IGB2_9GAST|nr:polyprotein [Elysia marginata]
MALYGQIKEFYQSEETIHDYLDRLSFYFKANEVRAEEKKRAVLLTLIGPQQFRLLKDLSAPAKPADKSYSELCQLLTKHHAPAPPKFMCRAKFDGRTRHPGESIADYIAALRHLSESCKFGDTLNDRLCEKFVTGVNNIDIQRKLLQERNLTLDKALQLATSIQQSSDAANVPVDINGQTVQFRLDTGAALTVITDKDFQTIADGKILMSQCGKQLQTYTGETVPVLGECVVDVHYGNHAAQLPLVVVEGRIENEESRKVMVLVASYGCRYIEKFVKLCSRCAQNSKKPANAPLHNWDWPIEPWKRIHIDFAGPFINKMFLIVIDSQSKWMEVKIMNSITASDTIVESKEIFSTHGLPDTIVSDNGPSFTAQEFKLFCSANGIGHITTSPYHPAGNGLAEKAVGIFKSAMIKMDTVLPP